MLLFNSKSGDGLYPLIESMAGLVREKRSQLPGLSRDSLDPSFEDIKGVLEGEEVFIRNEIYRSEGFRKIHMEIAKFGNRLQVFHCVFFPDPSYDLPILGLDLVVGPMGISAAILDLTPVGKNLSPYITDELEKIKFPDFKQVRELPEWGNIFSSYVQFIRPISEEEESRFLALMDSFLSILLSALANGSSNSADESTTIKRYEDQIFYCLQQKKNDKTRGVLARAFGPEWAERYINEVLFDCPPLKSNQNS